jgi:hypothetical protein
MYYKTIRRSDNNFGIVEDVGVELHTGNEKYSSVHVDRLYRSMFMQDWKLNYSNIGFLLGLNTKMEIIYWVI